MATAKRDAAAERTPPTAKRGRIGERMWSDVRRAARLAREEGVQLRVRHDGSVDIIGVLKQHIKSTPGRVVNKVQNKSAEPVAPTLPSTTADDTSLPPPSKSKERSTRRLMEFNQKKRAEIFAKKYGDSHKTVHRHEVLFQKRGHHPALAKAKLRWLLWRAWAQWRPVYGGTVLYYTSLREQYVYKRASKLYYAAFKSDPGKSGRPLAAWLRRATPMEMETASVASSAGSQPSKRAKKSRGSRVQGAAGGVVGPGG